MNECRVWKGSILVKNHKDLKRDECYHEITEGRDEDANMAYWLRTLNLGSD